MGTTITVTDNPSTQMDIIQISCSSNDCKTWINNNLENASTIVSSSSFSFDLIGSLSPASNSMNANLYYLVIHDNSYTDQEQKQFFNYVNKKFNNNRY
jgi:hypothetical protein